MKDEIINKMREEMPFELRQKLIPYIKESMDMYAREALRQAADEVINIIDMTPSNKILIKSSILNIELK